MWVVHAHGFLTHAIELFVIQEKCKFATFLPSIQPSLIYWMESVENLIPLTNQSLPS